MITLVAASAADAHSSFGRRELNPLLANGQGRFGGRGIALKALITGGAIGVQWLLVRKHPQAEKYAAITNFGMAAVFSGVAVYNHTGQMRVRLPRPATMVGPHGNSDESFSVGCRGRVCADQPDLR